MDRYDVIGKIGDYELDIQEMCDTWNDGTGLEHLIKYGYDGDTITITFPDELDICFCDTCEQAWLKGTDSRCECEKGGSND